MNINSPVLPHSNIATSCSGSSVTSVGLVAEAVATSTNCSDVISKN